MHVYHNYRIFEYLGMHKYHKEYRIAGNFDGGNIDVFDAIQPDRQNLTRQTFKSIQCLVKDSDHPSKYIPSNI